MKDLVLSANRLRRERSFYLVSLAISFLINLIAVVRFDRPWSELITQLGYVAVISVVVYLILWIPRLIAAGFRRLFGRRA